MLSGTCFLAGVLDPPILPTWGGSAADVMAAGSAHRAAWFASTWLITLSIAAGLAAVELLTRAPTSGQRVAGASLTISCPTARPSSATAILR